MDKYDRSIDLLNNDLFLEWRFLSTKELDDYWHKKILEDPSLEEAIYIADQYLKDNYFKKDRLMSYERDYLINSINKSLSDNHISLQRETFSFSWMNKAAMFLVLIASAVIISLFLYKSTTTVDSDMVDEIVGSFCEETDIVLMVGDEVVTYNKDVDIEVNESGVVSIDNEIVNTNEQNRDNVMNKIIIPHGKRSKIRLADNTMVWLNSGTTIEFPSSFALEQREIRLLKGECFLDVAEDTLKPFFIETDKMRIRVHGTKFNVSAYSEEQHQVVLMEGAVSLKTTNDESEAVFLKPNEQAIIEDDNSITKNKVDGELYTSWYNGYLIYKNTTMKDVLKQLERYYNLLFDYQSSKEIENIRCNGKLILSDDIENVLKTISIITSTSYTIDDNMIYINKQK